VVQVGATLTKSFTTSNGGGQRLTITRSKPPSTGVGFTGSPFPEGTSLAPGESRTVNVTFTPTSNGDQTDQWVLNADGTQGTLTVALRGTGAGGATDAGTGGGTTSGGHGCTASGGASLWPLVLLVGWMLRLRRRGSPVRAP